MTERLLAATKFSVPALPDRYIPRQRLHAALDAAAQLPLTLVVGMPCTGKAAAFFASTGDPENAISHFLAAGQDAEAFEVLRSNLLGAFYQEDGRMMRRLAAKFEGHAAASQPAHLPDLALALPASWPEAGCGSAT